MAHEVTAAANPREQIVVRAATDPVFREQLLANPKATLEQALGIIFPPALKVSVLEEAPGQICLVLPMLAPASEELADEQLAAVAGGDLPEPMPRVAALPGPLPTPTLTFSSLYLQVRRR